MIPVWWGEGGESNSPRGFQSHHRTLRKKGVDLIRHGEGGFCLLIVHTNRGLTTVT